MKGSLTNTKLYSYYSHYLEDNEQRPSIYIESKNFKNIIWKTKYL